MIIDVGNDKAKPSIEPLNMVYINDFGDRYHELDDEVEWNELERQARKVKRRYRNLHEYNSAVAIYCEYMAALSISYGRRELFNLALQAGNVKEFIPPFPRLKQTKANKTKLKKGIMDSLGDGRVIDEDMAREFLKNELSNYDPVDVNAVITLRPLNYKSCRFLDNKALDVVENGGKRSFTNSERLSEVDYLEEYFRAKNILSSKQKKKKKKGNGEDPDKLTGHDWFYHQYENEDDGNDSETIWYEGSLLTKDEIENVKLMRQLKEMGWDSLKLMNRTVREGSTFRHMKNIDKMEKRSKKKKKETDDFMTKLITDNKFDSFEDFESSMLDFSFDGIGSDGDEDED